MVISQTSGLWINIDDVFIGNHSAIGIQQINANIPKENMLSQNYPNPFNPSTKIRFSIKKTETVELRVFDILGKEISIMKFGILKPGYYESGFNAEELPSGIYFYRITAGEFTDTKRMILLK